MKKYIWLFLALALSFLLIWKFLKPSVYNIETPEKPAIGEMLYAEPLAADTGVYDYPSVAWDSIVLSEGLQKISQSAGHLKYLRKTNSLPAELISLWKDGIAYKQVLLSPVAVIGDKKASVIDYDGILFPDVNDTNKLVGVFKENYDENSINLKLEKKQPRRIIALWENYAISGFTDGEGIKLQIPAAAATKENSLIRVWVCDEKNRSAVCEIPLKKGRVINTMTINTDHDKLLKKALFARLRHASDLIIDPVWEVKTTQWIDLLLKDAGVLPVLLYGDFRGIRLDEHCTAMVSNYFGKKVVFIFNEGKKLIRTSIPLKGELKEAMGGSTFNIKNNRLEVNMMPGTVEILR